MPLQPWYVTGLVELAGTFTFSRTDRNIVPYFALKLGRDEGGLLEAIQDHFGGIGRIYELRGQGRTRVDTGTPTATRYFRISRLRDLNVVISHFDVYPLRGRKAEAYRIWRELVTLKRESYRKPDREKLDRICLELSTAVQGKSWRARR